MHVTAQHCTVVIIVDGSGDNSLQLIANNHPLSTIDDFYL